MRALGWVYLASYLTDAVLSAVALVLPDLVAVSNLISLAVAFFTIMACVFSAVGLLRPRAAFLPLAIYYLGMMAFGIVLAVFLVLQVGPHGLRGLEFTPQLLQERFPWYGITQMVIVAVWIGLGVFGLLLYARSDGTTSGDPAAFRD